MGQSNLSAYNTENYIPKIVNQKTLGDPTIQNMFVYLSSLPPNYCPQIFPRDRFIINQTMSTRSYIPLPKQNQQQKQVSTY